MILAGIVLIVAGVLTAWPRPNEEAHEHMPKAAWLLVAPVLAMLAFTPGPLGADAASTSSVVNFEPAHDYGPLPRNHGKPVNLSLADFWERVRFDPGHSVRGVDVRVVAFAVVDDTPNRLGRYLIACCAADAQLLSVDVITWPGGPPKQGQWLSAVIRQHGPANHDGTVTVDVLSVQPTDQPDDPYLVP
jgi:uncharacterized repeat protein (TIGR03943 family)